MKTKLTSSKDHNIFHHLFMIVQIEFLNLVWILAAISIALGGWVIFKYALGESFFQLAVGVPLFLLGITIFLFKTHESILVVFRPSRLKSICIFCRDRILGR